MYCKKCGGKVESYASHCPFCGEAMGGNDVTATYTTSIPAQNGASHKSIGGWLLTYIILGLPVVGFIMLLVWSFGKKTKANPTFRNWARMIFFVGLISVLLVGILVAIMLPTLMLALETYMQGMPPVA